MTLDQFNEQLPSLVQAKIAAHVDAVQLALDSVAMLKTAAPEISVPLSDSILDMPVAMAQPNGFVLIARAVKIADLAAVSVGGLASQTVANMLVPLWT